MAPIINLSSHFRSSYLPPPQSHLHRTGIILCSYWLLKTNRTVLIGQIVAQLLPSHIPRCYSPFFKHQYHYLHEHFSFIPLGRPSYFPAGLSLLKLEITGSVGVKLFHQ